MPASPLAELRAHEICVRLDPARFDFRTTAELPPLDEIIGQPRALRAIDLGLGIRHGGYHIYLSGLPGTGKMDLARRTLQRHAATEPPPPDWVYVNNFDESELPIALRLAAGQGSQLERDMGTLVSRLLEELPKAFQREDFGREKESLRQQYKQHAEELFGELKKMAQERQVAVQQMADGQILFMPLKDGKPISNDEAQKLSPEELQQIERRQQELIEATEAFAPRQLEIERQLNADVRQVERAFAGRVIEPLLAEIAQRYANDKITRWLDRLKTHFVKNLDRFRRRADRVQMLQPEAVLGEPMLADLQERFFEYQVNVLVDNQTTRQAPVVIETAPTYRNLFGTIDRVVDRYGRVVTNFTRIKSGSLLRANGGYLVINLEDALTEPLVWKELKRTLTSGQAEIEVYDPFSMFTIAALKPEPIPLDVKVVAVGSPLLYHLLYRYDDDFREIFKVKAEFDTEIARQDVEPRVFGQLVRKLSDSEGILPFDAAAVSELVCAASRMAADQRRVTSEFCRVVDLVREADYWCRRDGQAIVSAGHVRQALHEQIDRSDLIADKIRELIAEGTLLISLEGQVIGQANGLTVADLGDYTFGWPARVTASVGVGSAGVINIEREARLSGSTYDKGLLILEGYLRNQYAREQPLALSASLAMEQTYGGVDGDSASLVETLCLLSAIAGIPLRQDIAMTGSINQRGEVQAIGGANEKIEGFFDVCRERGLSGQHGVCLPRSNVHTLVLRHDVVEAVAQGTFHLWPVDCIDEAIELLTEFSAGSITQPQTFHGRVFASLKLMGEALRERRGPSGDHSSMAIAAPPAPPADPRPPFPGRSTPNGF